MGFDVFSVMKSRGKQPPVPLDNFSQILIDDEARDFVHEMDRMVCLVICSAIERNRNVETVCLFLPENKDVVAIAKSGALKFSELEKKSGQTIHRVFSPDPWKELIALTSLSDVQSFCECPIMRPSVLWRIILTEEFNGE